MAKQKGTDFDSYKSGRGNDDRKRPEEIVDILKLPDNGDKWTTIRMIGNLHTYAGYWVTTAKRDGKEGQFYTPSLCYDHETQEFDRSKYDPWLEAADRLNTGDRKVIVPRRVAYSNVIVRAEQKKAPKKLPKPTKAELKSGFKDKDSDTWTPVKVMAFPSSLMNK